MVGKALDRLPHHSFVGSGRDHIEVSKKRLLFNARNQPWRLNKRYRMPLSRALAGGIVVDLEKPDLLPDLRKEKRALIRPAPGQKARDPDGRLAPNG